MVGQLCTLFLLCFSKTCCLAKLIKNFYGVLHSRPIFYAVRLHVMTKTDGRCLNEWSLALFAVMSPKFYLNLMHFDVVVYMTHSVIANDTKEQ